MRRTNSGKKLERRLQEVEEFLDNLPRSMSTEFVKNTPIRSGNARNSTKLEGSRINADYAYARRLEKQGWSQQAPEGMSTPTIDWARQELRKL